MTELPLYPSEAQIARKVLGPNRVDEWKAMALIWERRGMPKVDPETGCRYWPAVEKWFNARHGLVSIAPGRFGPQDGGETCPEPKARKRPVSSGESVATVHQLPTGPHGRT